MTSAEPGRRDPPAPVPGDSVIRGVLFAIVCQIFFLIVVPLLTRRLLPAVSNPGSTATFLFTWWGVTQWVALIPLCIWQKLKGYPLTMNGILITGCIGFLLNAGCAVLFFNPLH
ncbi:MAG: hypothetical protein ACR2IV_19450 [Bryobacteraceae bacterium]